MKYLMVRYDESTNRWVFDRGYGPAEVSLPTINDILSEYLGPDEVSNLLGITIANSDMVIRLVVK